MNGGRELTSRQKTGNLGEEIACQYLKNHGYEIVERNYWKKWGEIDVVARNLKDKSLHFIEVKTVTRAVGGLTADGAYGYEAEENVHPWKLKRLTRAIQTYILERRIDEDKTPWQLDVITVSLDYDMRKARVKLIPDVF